ncbi:MAG TPA: hypothetical protein VE093_06480 [Polyangiaceae bacterium]|nr:hypothetical protein [Polyangiaceae bacterium]
MASDNDLAVNWAELDGGAAARGRAYLRAGMAPARERARQIQWQCHDIVSALYGITTGKEGVVVDVDDLLSATGMPDGQVYNALDRLEQDGAVRTFNGHCVMLLQKGIDAFEQAATKPYRRMSGPSSPPASGRPGLVATAPVAPQASSTRAPRS